MLRSTNPLNPAAAKHSMVVAAAPTVSRCVGLPHAVTVGCVTPMSIEHAHGRLEAFSDGVFAIALTLLILDIRLPDTLPIATNHDLWVALGRLAPSVFAFLLSFAIIFICWVNHNAMLRLVDKNSYPFMYANGLLLLTMVILPFPSALLGRFLLTATAAPATAVYAAANASSTLGWIAAAHAALVGGLGKDARSVAVLKENRRNGGIALVVYTACTIAAFWFPLTVTGVLAAIWIVWFFYGISLKDR